MTTTVLTPEQIGYVQLGVWQDLDPPRLSINGVNRSVGIRFDLNQRERPILSSLTLSLVIDMGASTVLDGTGYALTVMVYTLSGETAFSNSFTPPTLFDFTLAQTVIGDDVPSNTGWIFANYYSSSIQIASGTYTFALCPEVTGVTGTTYQDPYYSRLSAQNERAYSPVWGLADWTGHVHVGVECNNAALVSPRITSASLSVDWRPFFSGLAGGPTGGGIRAVRDGRFGMPAWNRDLIRDGDNPGLWVRSEDFDPEDEEQTYRPRPGEGTVDDGIPEG